MSIDRPEYVGKSKVAEAIGEPYVQTPEVIEKMRVAEPDRGEGAGACR